MEFRFSDKQIAVQLKKLKTRSLVSILAWGLWLFLYYACLLMEPFGRSFRGF